MCFLRFTMTIIEKIRFSADARLLALLLIGAVLGGGCKMQSAMQNDGEKKAEGENDKKAKKERGVPVEVAAVSRGPIEEVIKSSNHLEAEQEIKVFSRAANLVSELLVEEGIYVQKDQVLLRLEDTDQTTTYKKTLSQLNKSTANFKRTTGMFKDQLVPQKEFDDAKFDLEQLTLALDEAQRQVDFTSIKAPISGTITARMVKLGDHVNPNQHLFTIIDFDSIEARIYVPERYLADLKTNQLGRIYSHSLPGKVFDAHVKRIAPVVDSTSGTVKITLGVEHQGELRPGMFVDVELVIATHPLALLIAKRSIVYDNDQMYVYRLMEERRVERVFVEPLLADRDHIEPKSGFKDGDEIVIAGQTGLKEDALVTLPGDPLPDEDKDESKVAETNAPPAATGTE
jgi:membrane fusion protein, multidrug efflux system